MSGRVKSEINHDTLIEDLVNAHPSAVTFLMDCGIRCLACGEPAWGTLRDAMREKRMDEKQQQETLKKLRTYLINVKGDAI